MFLIVSSNEIKSVMLPPKYFRWGHVILYWVQKFHSTQHNIYGRKRIEKSLLSAENVLTQKRRHVCTAPFFMIFSRLTKTLASGKSTE